MTSQWPVSEEEPPRALRSPCVLARAEDDGRRLENASADLLLPDATRLSDRVRAFASAMLHDLLSTIEGELRSLIAIELQGQTEIAASFAAPEVAITLPILIRADILRHPPLTALLLRRADAFVLAARLSPDRDGASLSGQASSLETRDAAVALLVAQERRVDRFGAPTVLFNDLPAELAHWLVWRVAAAVGHHLRVTYGLLDPEIDRAVTSCARAVLATHDEGQGLDAAAWWLAHHLSDQPHGDLLADLLEGGEVVAFNAVLAAAISVPAAETWKLLADPRDGRLAIALRAGGATRETAARVLVLLLPPGVDPVDELTTFDACEAREAAVALSALALDPAYRAALAELAR